MSKKTEFGGTQGNSKELERLMRSLEFPRVPHFSIIWLALALIVSVLGTSCGVTTPSSGHLEVRLRDHREAIGDFSGLWITFPTVSIHPVGQPRSEGWIEFEHLVQRLDLTQYVDGQEAVIAQAMVEPGVYNAVRLQVDVVAGNLSNGRPAEVKANFEPVALNFRVREGRTTVLTLDLVVLDMTDHPGQSYELQVREVNMRGGE